MQNLTGEWKIWLEGDKEEVLEKEFPKREHDGRIMLPGILQDQGYGNSISIDTPWVSGLHDPFWYEREEYQYGQEDGVNVPFLAQPPCHYIGRAWYEREFIVTKGTEKECFLFIECTHWRSMVWIDGELKGEDCSLCTAHQIHLGELEEGTHTLTVCIDNRFQYPYRPDGHEVSDALGATWNGMVGEISILTLDDINWREEEKKKYAMEHHRIMEVKDGLFYVDGRQEYFRGTHFGGDYPLTGYPETQLGWWDKLMQTIKEWGFNFIRCHSYCPPEAAFVAADREGVYIQVECGMWNVFNEGIPMLLVLKQETRRILKQFGHHPSFVLFSTSNEPSGQWYEPLKQWVEETREYDESLGYGKRRLYTAQSGWYYDVPPKEIIGTDYIYFHRSAYGPLFGGTIRGYEGWNGKDYGPSIEGAKLPVVCHEMGQWCAYPDFSVIEKFTGYLRPGNYKVFRENARAHGLLDRNQEFVHCSGKNQVLMIKEEMEANFRTPHMYGFEMLDLHDYLGQGTALVGVLDPFWESKGYVRPEEFREFCQQTVLLARMSSYVYKTTDKVTIPVEVCHFGREPIGNCDIEWTIQIEENGLKKELQRGIFKNCQVPIGKNIELGTISPDFTPIREHVKLTMSIWLGNVKNHWDFYVYHESANPIVLENPLVLYTRDWQEAKQGLECGERVIFAPYLSELDFDCPPLSMRPVFWNSQMGPVWSRSLGLVVQKEHPLFRYFPTEEYGGWQWESILSQSRGFFLDDMPKELKPIVSAIDDWNRNLPLGLIFEGKVGKGRLLFVSANLDGEFSKRPEAVSLKHALITYASSEAFSPQVDVTLKAMETHFFPNDRMKELGANYLPESQTVVRKLEALSDANPNSSVWIEKNHYPIYVDITLEKKIPVSGLLVVPDQRDRYHQGCVKEYVIHVKVDEEWKAVARGEFQSSFMTQKVQFLQEYQTDTIRFTALSGYAIGERSNWKQLPDGWHCVEGEATPSIQVAGFHVICESSTGGKDSLYWNQNQGSSTEEIEG